MTVQLPKSLKPRTDEQPQARRASRRLLRKALRELGLAILTQNEYGVVDSLPIARAHAFNVRRGRETLRIGLRVGADRWVAVTQTALSKEGELQNVDEIILVTFADPKTRNKVQVWRFDASVVAGMAREVFAAADGATGQQWLPLDDALDTSVHSMTAGSLSQHGSLIAEEALEWVDEAKPANLAGSSTGGEPGMNGERPLTLTIAQAKAGLAAQFGVQEDAIRITIEG